MYVCIANMEDFDIFTKEIESTKPLYTNLLNKFVKDIPSTPNGPNYQSARKLQAEECLSDNDDLLCAFHLSEAVSASVRTMAVYREEQLKANADKLYMIQSFIKPVRELAEANNGNKGKEGIKLPINVDEITDILKKYEIDEKEPLYKKYLRFTPENNVDNFQRILKELPKEWTIVQITAPYNPGENLKPWTDYRTEINSLYLSVLTNDYLDEKIGPLNVIVPANVLRAGEKPLFAELYSLLEENYKTIENAQFLNNKRLVQNYWSRREAIDLRMKSVIHVMDKEWLGGWSCLLTGKLLDSSLRDRVKALVDITIADWGFIRLTKKQKILLYNLVESSPALQSGQIKSCIRKILTENGDPDDLRQVLATKTCGQCSLEFNFATELCLKCLSKCFEAIHKFTLVDGIKAFSQAAIEVREYEEWAALRQAKRHPVVLIVDEMIDTFPWESLPLLNTHPVSRMENIHFLYFLYKTHEDNIRGGYFLAKAEDGRYVINPENNLDRMEKRMSSFVQYWCPQWCGDVSKPPEPDVLVDYLKKADMFLYCGHGDGCQYANGAANGAGVEGAAGGRATAVLSGCGSARLAPGPGRAPPSAAHHHYHVGCSPMVIGMLWEVTDLEVDKVVSSLMALSVPSTQKIPWECVGKAKWSQGVLDTNVEAKSQPASERNLLAAVAKARRSTSYVMIASSVVARGLPIRILERGEK